MFGRPCRTVSRAIPEYDPALCPLMLMCPSMTWSGSSRPAVDVGSLLMPLSGWLVSRCVNNLRHCIYPGWGDLRWAGVIGQNSRSRVALAMIWAWIWGSTWTPSTLVQACNPMGNTARWSNRYSCAWAVPATVAAFSTQSSCLLISRRPLLQNSCVARSGGVFLTPATNAAYPQRICLFLLELAPFPCCFCVGSSSDETQIWLEDLRVVVCWFLVVFCGFSALVDTVFCTFLAFTTSTSVRTEPQATSAEEKNNAPDSTCWGPFLDSSARKCAAKKGWRPFVSSRRLIWSATAAAGILNWKGPLLRACFCLRFKIKRSLLCHIVLLQFPQPWGPGGLPQSLPWRVLFTFYALATLEFKTCTDSKRSE